MLRMDMRTSALLESRTKKINWLTQDKWEIDGGNFSPDGKQSPGLPTWTATPKFTCMTSLPERLLACRCLKDVNHLGGAESAFTHDGIRLLYYHNGPTSPNDVWIYSIADGKSQQITHSLVAGVRSEDMVEPLLVHYPSRDGKWTISAFFMFPTTCRATGRTRPLFTFTADRLHRRVNSFNRFIQHIVNQGYMVIAPNYRGSTGYGKEFQHANLFDMGGGDLQDVLGRGGLFQADWICRSQEIDSDGRQLRWLFDHDGSDQSSGGLGGGSADRAVRELVHGDRRMKIRCCSSRIWRPWVIRRRTRTLSTIARRYFLWTRSKRRCCCWRAAMIRDALRRKPCRWWTRSRETGGVAEYKIYENEGHGFARVENQIDAYKRVSEFLKARVPPANCGCSLTE